MARLVKIWTLEDEFAAPEIFDKVKQEGAETLASLRVRLETEEVLDWEFDYWDVEDKRRIRKKVERLNDVEGDVYVIRSQGANEDPLKRRRLEDGSHVEGGPDPICNEEQFDLLNDMGVPVSIDLVGSSRVSGISGGTVGTVDDTDQSILALRSTLISAEVMERYHAQAEKLKRDLKDSDLDDHKWELRSWDQDGVGVVKLYCCECRKETGGQSGNHSKVTIQNLFSNFRTSHLQSIQHIKSWCRKHNVNYLDHPQSVAPKGKAIVLTTTDHRRLMAEGVDIMNVVNAELQEGMKPFHTVNRSSTSGKQSSSPCNLQVMLQYFRKCPGHLKFKYDHTDSRWIDVDTIITTVTLSYNSSTDVYTLDSEDADALNQFINDQK